MSQQLTRGRSRRRGRPPVDDAAAAATRERVLDAAAGLFAEHGVDAVSVEEIAEAAGLSRAGVYRYVGGRDDIVLGVTLRRFQEWVDDVMRHAARFDTAAERLAECVVWTVRTVGADAGLSALVSSRTADATASVASSSPAALDVIGLFADRLADLLEPVRGELRPGLSTTAIGARLLDVILDRLDRHDRLERPDGGAGDARLRAWLDAWVLPSMLAEPPPLPPFARTTRSNP